jgi:GT2 family glycosyltransferase
VTLPTRLVVATRVSQERFHADTFMGRCLKNFAWRDALQLRLFANNRLGLPTVYNQAIKESRDHPATLVFVHDDVYMCDFYLPERLDEALEQIDIIGLAGCTARVRGQTSWFRSEDPAALSGMVSHGKTLNEAAVSVYGQPCQRCVYLDGLFLATRSESLHNTGVHFDERFNFHFYDLDFCRQAEQRGLTMATWPLSVIHQSDGITGGPTKLWNENCDRFLEKWGN